MASSSPNRGSLNSSHIRGTLVPVEEPSTASKAVAEMNVDGPTGPRPRTQMKRSIAEQGLDRSNCAIIRASTERFADYN
jgi:hypothetical protein